MNPKPQFAVNFSRPTVEQLQSGRIHLDRLKCPAWPELIRQALEIHPVYVHFPLKIGSGRGAVQDFDTGKPADWAKIEAIMAQTGTPMVNLHFSAFHEGEDALPEVEQAERVAERAIRDVQRVIERFGPERVVVENESPALEDHPLRAVYLPQTIRRVVEATGCGFLFDISHARLAANMLGMSIEAYVEALPVSRTREIHVTGIQIFDQGWIERLEKDEGSHKWIPKLAGRPMDHLPLTVQDWQFLAWAMGELRQGKWGAPWVIAFEYGGIGPFWGPVTLPETLADQIPRLKMMIDNL